MNNYEEIKIDPLSEKIIKFLELKNKPKILWLLQIMIVHEDFFELIKQIKDTYYLYDVDNLKNNDFKKYENLTLKLEENKKSFFCEIYNGKNLLKHSNFNKVRDIVEKYLIQILDTYGYIYAQARNKNLKALDRFSVDKQINALNITDILWRLIDSDENIEVKKFNEHKTIIIFDNTLSEPELLNLIRSKKVKEKIKMITKHCPADVESEAIKSKPNFIKNIKTYNKYINFQKKGLTDINHIDASMRKIVSKVRKYFF